MNLIYEAKIKLEINLNSIPLFNDEMKEIFLNADKSELTSGIEEDIINAIRKDFSEQEGSVKVVTESVGLDL